MKWNKLTSAFFCLFPFYFNFLCLFLFHKCESVFRVTNSTDHFMWKYSATNGLPLKVFKFFCSLAVGIELRIAHLFFIFNQAVKGTLTSSTQRKTYVNMILTKLQLIFKHIGCTKV